MARLSNPYRKIVAVHFGGGVAIGFKIMAGHNSYVMGGPNGDNEHNIWGYWSNRDYIPPPFISTIPPDFPPEGSVDPTDDVYVLPVDAGIEYGNDDRDPIPIGAVTGQPQTEIEGPDENDGNSWFTDIYSPELANYLLTIGLAFNLHVRLVETEADICFIAAGNFSITTSGPSAGHMDISPPDFLDDPGRVVEDGQTYYFIFDSEDQQT